MTLGIISIILWIGTIIGYVVYNLYKKNVKLEEMVVERDQLIKSLSDTIAQSGKILEEVDRLGAFKSDDEIGFFFTTIKQIQNTLEEFIIKR